MNSCSRTTGLCITSLTGSAGTAFLLPGSMRQAVSWWIFNEQFVAFPLIQEPHRLFFPQKVLPEWAFLPSEACQRKACRKNNTCLFLCPPVPDFLCQRCQRQQIIGVIRRLILHQCLPPGPAHIIFPGILQHVLHVVGYKGRVIVADCGRGIEKHRP